MTNIIFGAQGYALGLYTALKTLNPDYRIPCFMVSSLDGNPTVLAGESTYRDREDII